LKNKKIKLFTGGLYHSMVYTEEGDLIAWGFNKYGQMGLSSKTFFYNYPILINNGTILKNKNIIDISCGLFFILFF